MRLTSRRLGPIRGLTCHMGLQAISIIPYRVPTETGKPEKNEDGHGNGHGT